MFDRLVGRYDLLNSLLSLGLDRRWRRAAARAGRVRSGDVVLDLGTGTGALGAGLEEAGLVVGVDLSLPMLRVARRRGLRAVQGSAFALPFPDRAFDAVLSGFVLRNLDDLSGAFAEVFRVLRPGGRVSLVDITEPENRVVRRLFDAYFGTVAPALGAAVGRRRDYRYLVRSLGQLPSPPAVVEFLRRTGFADPAAAPLTMGTVTLFTGVKPDGG